MTTSVKTSKSFENPICPNRIHTKLKFIKSDETGALVSFVSQNPKTLEYRGVRQDSPYPKKICIVDKALSSTILTNVLYDCSLISMAEKNGYVCIKAEPVQFKAYISTTYQPHSVYKVEVKFGNKTICFDPFSGRCESVRDLTECKKVLEKRVDVQNLIQVVEDFVRAGNNILSLMKIDNARKTR